MALSQPLQDYVLRYLPLVFLGILIAKLLFNKYGGGLNAIPGPFLAGFTNLWRVFHTSFSDITVNLIHAHTTFNYPFVRIGPRVVSISDPDLIPTIYGIKSKFTKTDFYSVINLWHKGRFTPSLFESRDAEYHARIRRPIANAYSMTTIVDFEPAVDSTTKLLMSKLDRSAASVEPVSLEKWLQWYGFDVLGEILFSRKLGFLQSETDVEGIVAGIRGFTKYWQAFLLHNPLMVRYGPAVPMLEFAMNRLNEEAPRRGIDDFTKRDDFLQRCFDAQRKHPDVVTDWMIVLYTFNNIGAGSDTTAATLTSIFYYLLRHPSTMQKVVDEVDHADQADRLSEFVTSHEAGELRYLQACIKEAVRMHPPIGMILERHVPKGGIVMKGHYFPEGTIVGINAWVTAFVMSLTQSHGGLSSDWEGHRRNRKVYGDDCDTFRPERWLEASADQLAAMERANFAFGHGARACIGMSVSKTRQASFIPMIFLLIPPFLGKFSFAQPGREWKVHGGWFVWQEGVEVVIKRRNTNFGDE